MFFIVIIFCEYHHLQIIAYKSFKITNLDYDNLLFNPGIFVGALCNIIFTTKIQVAPTLFFSADFIQWANSYIGGSSAKVLMKIDAVLFGYIVPIIINLLYAMLIGVIAVRIRLLLKKKIVEPSNQNPL